MEMLMDGQVVLEEVSVALEVVPQCWSHSLCLHMGLDGVKRVRFACGEL